MKKYILGSLLGLFGLIGTFASAENYSFTDGGNEKYTPYTFTTEGGTLYNLNYTCNSNKGETECAIYIIGNGNDNYGQVLCSMVVGYNNEISEGAYNGTPDNLCKNGLNVEAGDYRVKYGGYTSLSNVSFSIGEYSGGGNINEDDNGNIISSGISAFGGIIDKLGSLTGEFIPYLIYIAIGILGVSLIFRVVKYLLGYMKGESMNSFDSREGMKARRTRRRRNRRFTRYLRKNYKNDTPKFGQYGYQSRRE